MVMVQICRWKGNQIREEPPHSQAKPETFSVVE